MVESQQQRESTKWWWFGRVSDSNQKRSPWLQSTLSELDEKTRAMLKLIEQDADSFAQRAEMYYKKRPELISMVQEFYITHRSLAERFDLFRSESGIRLMTPWASPLSVTKCSPQGKSVSSISMDNRTCDTYSETYATEEEEEYEESDVEDPEPEEQMQLYNQTEINQIVPSGDGSNQAMTKLMEKIERLQEENRAQKERLVQKDEEKRDVIRQLSLAMDLLREENRELRKRVVFKDSPQKHKHSQPNRLDIFWSRLFSRSSPPPEIKS